jgi:hypothetical protein
MAETAMERIPGIDDDSIADSRIVRSSTDSRKENSRGKSRTAFRRYGDLFSGCENDEGQRYVISYLVSQGMTDKQVSMYLLSHAKTTERADRHSFTLMSKISNTHGVSLQATKSRDEAYRCLADMVAWACDYVDPENEQTDVDNAM